mmetsp:Transcript_5090/g.15287  ORF Transcript_5090/g.15287 Transcript_5090/m.15287 type:complete len:127 (+) Transcript_5090:81-461(+)
MKRGREAGDEQGGRRNTGVNGNADGDANGGVGVSSNVVSLEAPERPLVVFCSNCKTILGDTNSFVCTHAELKTITLRSKCITITLLCPLSPLSFSRGRLLGGGLESDSFSFCCASRRRVFGQVDAG